MDRKSVNQRQSALSRGPHSSPSCPSPYEGTWTSCLLPCATNGDKPHMLFPIDQEAETCHTPSNNHSRTSFSAGFEFYQERVLYF